MKKIIGLGIFSITIIYPLLYPLGQVFRNVTTTQFKYTAQKALMNSFLMYLSEILLGCINLCYKCWSLKSDKDIRLSKVEVNNEFIFLEQQQEEKLKVSKRMYLYLFILCLFNLFAYCLPMIEMDDNKMLNKQLNEKLRMLNIQLNGELKFIKILFISLLCKLVFSHKLYRHQISAMVLILIGMVINLSTLLILKIDLIQYDDPLKAIGLFLLCFIISSIQIVGEKYLFNKYKISPYDLMFYEGLFGVFFLSISEGFLYYFTCPNFISECNHGDHYNITFDFITLFQKKQYFLLYILLWLLCNAYINYFGRQAVFYYSPTTESISDALGGIVFFIYIKFIYVRFTPPRDDSFIESLIPFIGYFFIILGSLMYNEIIILYVFGLEENTMKEVSKRAGEDTKNFKISNKGINMGFYPMLEEEKDEDINEIN